MTFLYLLLFGSCTVERSIAKKYLETRPDTAILIMSPDFVYKSNLKLGEIEGAESLNDYVKDSLLFEKSIYLQYISDSVLLEKYLSSLITELRDFGFDVYTEENIDTFLQIQKPGYMFNLAQIEMEEYIVPVEEQEVFDDTVLYFKTFKLNAVSINSWFEVTRMNTEDYKRKVLYASHYVFDYLKGSFRKHALTGDVKFKYYQKEMKIEDIYSLAAELGQKYAGYIIDYILNEKIREELPENINPNKYYHYDYKTHTLKPAYEERFTEL